MFQILREPFDADASIRSSELRHKDRTSARCPGKSTLNKRVASGISSLDFAGGGTVYTSRALVFKATNNWDTVSCVRRNGNPDLPGFPAS